MVDAGVFVSVVCACRGYINTARARLREFNQQLAKAMQDIGAAMRVIQDQATHDELTGIHNRRFIMEAIHTEKSRAERTGEQFCVLLLDLDHFKRINDQFGHLAGDQTLIAISQTVARDMRAMDCFGRYGGEEFLLLMPRTMQAGAQNGAERMRVRISGTEFDHVEPGLRVTVSIGVAQWGTGESAEQLIALADQALYSAKAEGRNRVCAAAPRGAAIK